MLDIICSCSILIGAVRLPTSMCKRSEISRLSNNTATKCLRRVVKAKDRLLG